MHVFINVFLKKTSIMVGKLSKFFILCFLFAQMIISSSAVLIDFMQPNEDFNYVYYVNSSNLEIELTLESISKPLIFKNATLSTSNSTSYEASFDRTLTPGNEITLYLDISEFKSNGSSYTREIFEEDLGAVLNLNFYELDGAEYKDDTLLDQVFIYYENPQIELVRNNFLYYRDSDISPILRTQFKNSSSSIYSYEKSMIYYSLYDMEGNEIASTPRKNSYLIGELQSSLELDFFENYDSGSYSFIFEYANLAGTKFRETISVSIEDEYLFIDLLTSEDDESLEYFYADITELYGNSIPVGQRDFTFKVKTNKESLCYFNSQSVTSTYVDNSLLYSDSVSSLMNADENFVHSIDISPFVGNGTSKYFWVGCSDVSGLERKSLHESLEPKLSLPNQNLFFTYHDEQLELELIYPTRSLVTNTDFTTRLLSSTQALCSLMVAGVQFDMVSNDYRDHRSSLSLDNGNYNLEYSCRDILNKEKTLSQAVEIDTTRGVAINVDDMYYSGANTYTLEFTTSDVVDSCRYTKDPSNVDDFESFPLIGSNANSFNVTFSPLTSGENPYFIHCKLGIVSTEETSILFDQSGPSLSNLSFSFEGISTQQYLPVDGDVDLEFDVTTTIPVDEYEIVLSSSNTSDTMYISASNSIGNFEEEISLDEEFESYTKISIAGINLIGKKGNTLEQQILFDRTAPEVNLIKNGNSWVVTCIDIETKCNDVWYGLSNSLLSCTPSLSYGDGDLLDATGHSVICARAINSVGLLSETTTVKTGEIVSTTNGTSSVGGGGSYDNPFDGDDQTQGNTSVNVPINDSIIDDIEDPVTPPSEPIESYDPEEDSNTTTVVILSALAFILLAAGGGGYYAYKKGYLNKQLQQLGIKVPTQPGSSSTNDYYGSSVASSKTPISQRPQLTSGNQKSKYDEHLAKLNTFLDDTLDKKTSVFDSFKTSQKGRVEKYDDTLAKPKGNSSAKKDAEFDDFYKASSSTKSIDINDTTSENEADKFEQYYKNKKESSKKTDKSKSKKQ